jgi:photosynthetic reaction center cytochrome c subunit
MSLIESTVRQTALLARHGPPSDAWAIHPASMLRIRIRHRRWSFRANWRGNLRSTPVLAAVFLAAVLLLSGCERTESVQRGYRGTGMMQLYKSTMFTAASTVHNVPEPEPAEVAEPDTPLAKDVHINVQVLTDLNVLDFSRLMQAMSTWIAPEEGCEFCHNPDQLESDEKYTKVVARRMLEMTRQINTDWKSHVAGTGVTCWTCHRGQAVPSGDWFANPGPKTARGMLGNKGGQNTAGVVTNGNSALPFDPLSAFLAGDHAIPVQSTTALPSGNRQSIKQTEWTYAMMIYMAKSLGVNCTYCHNTRAMGRWEESTPQRKTAWHGIRMVRDLNNAYLKPLAPLLPAMRLSPEGDGPKVGCATCHKGIYKPLYGVSMLNDYPELAGPSASHAAVEFPPAPPPAKPAAKQAAKPAATPAAAAVAQTGAPR